MKSILDPSFRYTKSIDTDIRKTFARIRREHAGEVARREAAAANNVKPLTIPPRKKGTV